MLHYSDKKTSVSKIMPLNKQYRQCYPTKLFGRLCQCSNVGELQVLNNVYNHVLGQPWQVVHLSMSESRNILQCICTKHLFYITCQTADARMMIKTTLCRKHLCQNLPKLFDVQLCIEFIVCNISVIFRPSVDQTHPREGNAIPAGTHSAYLFPKAGWRLH